MKSLSLLKFSIIFLTGMLLGTLINFVLVYGLENPFLNNFGLSVNNNVSVPFDYIKENQIEIYSDKIILNIENTSLSKYAATGSMVPVLNEDSNGIRIVPKSEEEIHIGDIITFEKDSILIVHRVIEKNNDEKGIYFITKGDNNELNDGMIRFNQIKYKTIGVLW